MFTRSLKWLIAGLALTLSASAFATTYPRCEVDALMVRKGEKAVKMTCYSGHMRAEWKACRMHASDFGRDGFVGGERIMPHFDTSDCKGLAALRKEVRSLRFQLDGMCGYCARIPQSRIVEVSNVKRHISFFYMALKDRVVLSNVTIENGELVEASLERNARYIALDRLDGSRPVTMSEPTMMYRAKPFRHGGPESMHAAVEHIVDDTGMGSGEATSEDVCAMSTKFMEGELSRLKSAIAERKRVREGCNGQEFDRPTIMK